jgi:hypothetical protein
MEKMESRFRPEKGEPGPQGGTGSRGPQGRPGISRGARSAIIALLVLVLLVGGGNLWTSWDQSHAAASQARSTEKQLNAFKHKLAAEQAVAARAGALVEKALCSDVGTMARIKPPPGAAAANPSRAYEQAESRAWHGLVLDLGCR